MATIVFSKKVFVSPRAVFLGRDLGSATMKLKLETILFTLSNGFLLGSV